MKQLLFCLSLLVYVNNLTAQLSGQERLFVELNKVSAKEQTVLDKLFTDLDPEITQLFTGKHVKGDAQYFITLFERQGFIVHSIHHRPLNHPDSDNRPARVVLSHDFLPDCFIKVGFDPSRKKANISRVLLASKINNIIDDLDIKTIGKVCKKVYHRIDRPDDELSDFNYVVLSLKKDGNAIGKRHIKRPRGMKKEDNLAFTCYRQKCDFLVIKNLTGFSDIYSENFMIGCDGVLYIIDTEAKQHVADLLWKEVFEA